MKNKNKLKNILSKTEKCNIKKVLQVSMKKMLISLIIVINVFFYIPIAAFAEVDSDKRVPATVPAVANEIISKYVNTKISTGSTSGAGGIITSYEESGDGWNSVTEVKAPNGVTRKYRNYKQFNNGNSYWNNHYWEGNIASDACGPSCVAIVLSGYGYDSNPGDVVDVMHNVFKTDASDSFEKLMDPLKYIGNIEAEAHYGVGTSADISIIRENFKEGRPIIVNAPGHYVVYLGEDENGNLIISDPGRQDGWHERYGTTLEEVINRGNITCGYILIKSDGNATLGNSIKPEEEKSDVKTQSSPQEDTNKSNAGEIFIWPVGGKEIITAEGKEFTNGTPELGIDKVSRGGVSRGWSSENHSANYAPGEALDIAGNGTSNVYNVVAMATGKVTSCGDGIAEGDASGYRRNGKLCNYRLWKRY